ncbi:ADP-ribosylation factor-like protein 16 isoform X1, partial [Clarias magur]
LLDQVALPQKYSRQFYELKVQLCQRGEPANLGEPPATLPTVGTNLTDLTLKKRSVTVRELGGCMGPIWPSYFRDCTSVIFMVDSANIAQISSSCIQLLSVLSAEPLRSASVLVLFNK